MATNVGLQHTPNDKVLQQLPWRQQQAVNVASNYASLFTRGYTKVTSPVIWRTCISITSPHANVHQRAASARWLILIICLDNGLFIKVEIIYPD